MRSRIFVILVSFLCGAAVGMCQSAPTSHQASASPEKSGQQMQQQSGCTIAAADFPVSHLVPQQLGPQQEKHPAQMQAWRWDAPQPNAQSPSAFTPAARSCRFNAELLRSFQAKLEPLPAHPGSSNFGPIPTQWPNAKFEPIPTTWPNLKFVKTK